MRYYLDTEFDGAGGPLISLALVDERGGSIYCVVSAKANDPWVRENVLPVLWDCPLGDDHLVTTAEHAAGVVADFLALDKEPVIVADWLADIAHLCRLLTVRSLYWSDPNGDLRDMPPMRFEASNVDAYPTRLEGAVQHNAWWDAMALWEVQRRRAKPEAAQVRASDPG